MFGRVLRVSLGLAACGFGIGAGAAGAFAVDAAPDGGGAYNAPSYDSYVADPADSSVVETSADADSYTDGTPIAWQKTEPQCVENHQAVVGSGHSAAVYGTACQRSDGSLLIVPAVDRAPGPLPVTYVAQNRLQYCREYQEIIDNGGRPMAAYGTACWQPDGSWQIVTAPTMATMPAVQRVNAAPGYPAAPYAVPTYPAPAYQAPAAFAPVAPAISNTRPQPAMTAPVLAGALTAVAAVANVLERVAEARPATRSSRIYVSRAPVAHAFSPRMSAPAFSAPAFSTARATRASAPLSRWVHAPAAKHAARRKS